MDAFDAQIRQRAREKRASLPTEVYQAAANGELPREKVGPTLNRLALLRTHEAINKGTIQPEQARDFFKIQNQQLDQFRPVIEEAAVAPNAPVGSWAPTSPGELGLAGGISVGGPMLASKLFGYPMSLKTMMNVGAGPLSLPFGVLGDVGALATAPLTDPRYLGGERGYLASLGPGLDNQVRYIGQKSREARDRYGILGLPVQALHGVWNPISSTAYMLKNVKDSIFDKAGQVALRAEPAISRSLKEMPHAV